MWGGAGAFLNDYISSNIYNFWKFGELGEQMKNNFHYIKILFHIIAIVQYFLDFYIFNFNQMVHPILCQLTFHAKKNLQNI